MSVASWQQTSPPAPEPVRVSVIVPTRDRPALLREALTSIRALEGPGLCLEILVGDNGGLPETAEIARELGATHLLVGRGRPATLA